jgi:hypothetical protein
VIGTWKGLSGFRETELELGYQLGEHLESWYTCTLAAIPLLGGTKGMLTCETKAAKAVHGIQDPSNTTKVLVIGLGGGSIPAFLRTYAPNMLVECVEICAQVATAAVEHFGLKCRYCNIPTCCAYHDIEGGPRLKGDVKVGPGNCVIHITDAEKFVVHTKSKFDSILLDVYTNGQFPSSLLDSQFFKNMRDILARNGSVAVNAGGDYNMLKALMAETFGSVLTLCESRGNERVLVSGNGRDISVIKWRQDIIGNGMNLPFQLETCKGAEDIKTLSWGLYDGTGDVFSTNKNGQCFEEDENVGDDQQGRETDTIPCLANEQDPWALFD